MDNQTLDELHGALLIILDEIDHICRRNNINYFLDSGTALGAIRHSGFIPWDDDADVGMLREDYDRFIDAAKRELSSKFFLQTHESEPDYVKFNAKIRLNGTYFPEERNFGRQLNQGIFVDIYPFEYTSDERECAIKETNAARFWFKVWMLRENRMQKDKTGTKILRKCAHIIPQNFLEQKCRHIYEKHRLKPTKTLTCYTYKMNDDNYLYFKTSDFSSFIDVKFEDRNYKLMSGYDNYLKTMYGDYMELPPKEKRVSHYEGVIDFGR